MKPFSSKSKTFGLGQISFGAFGVFSINQSLFLQKTRPLYPNPKYLFGIEI
jgi:hypothetical protein